MRQRNLVFADIFDLAFSAIDNIGRLDGITLRHLVHAHRSASQARFRVHQELPGDHYVLAGFQSFANFALPVRFNAKLHVNW